MIKQLLTATAVAALSASVAIAQQYLPQGGDAFTKWGEADGWTIYVDDTRGTCLAERIDANQNVLQIGVTEDKTMGYIGVFTKNDVGLKSGKEKLTVSIDGKLYEGPARRVAKHLPEGYQGGYLLANNPVFIEDVMKKYDMVVFPKHENAFTVSLDGTLKAIEAGRKCNAEQNS